MKKVLKVLICVVCLIVTSVVLTACELFGAPKVKGCTYRYDKTDCDLSELTVNDRLAVDNQLTAYRNKISELAFSEEGTVEITSATGVKTTCDYSQVGTDVIIPDGPNKNHTYRGDMVLAFTVARESNEVLKWSITLMPYNEAAIDVVMYYNIVPSTGVSAE